MKENTTDRPWETVRSDDEESPIHERMTVQSDQKPSDLPETPRAAGRFTGIQIGNYRVEQPLGHGGFGSVFRAYDEKLGRHVAIKFLHSTIDERHQQLFEREARAIARLNKHPNIVKIFEYGEFEGQNYFVLEYVTQNVAALLQENKSGLPLSSALRIIAETADALSFAHEQGIIHRDVKPSNILLEGDGGPVKVADFGLSRFLESNEVTISGTVSGTPPYMSPEQARGAPVDSRTDIFSLGVTLYETLTGERPFVGASMAEVMDKIIQDNKIPLRTRRNDLPEVLYATVDKAMAPHLSDRYQSAKDMAADIGAALKELGVEDAQQTVHASSQTPKRKKLRPVLLTAALLLVVLGGFSLLRHIPGAKDTPLAPNVAHAMQQLETKDNAGAEKAFRDLLNQFPTDASIRRGLGFALLQQGKLDEAAEVFDAISDKSIQTEGKTAVLFAKGGADALPAIQETNRTDATPYTLTLEGLALSIQGQNDRALEVLNTASEKPFSFDWQHTQCMQALGQAYFHAGKFSDAERVFRGIEGKPTVEKAIAAGYLARIRAQIDQTRRQEVLDRLEKVKTLIKTGAAAQARDDVWSSRPLTFVILPTPTNSGRVASESGLVDVLPTLLGDALSGTASMTLVDRELIQDLLTELQLSAQLGTQTDQLRLGKVLGARVLIRCEFMQVASHEFVHAKLVDTETSESIPVAKIELAPGFDVTTFVQQLAAGIANAVKSQYPIQGRVQCKDNVCRINVGSSVGVSKGMRFKVLTAPGQQPLEKRFVVVTDAAEAEGAVVSLEGFSAQSIPKDGWYVAEATETEKSAV